MTNAIEVTPADGYVEVHATGKLTKEFYEQFVPALETQIKAAGKLRLLFVMTDFHGWTAGAMWEDIKFDMKHWKDIANFGSGNGKNHRRFRHPEPHKAGKSRNPTRSSDRQGFSLHAELGQY